MWRPCLFHISFSGLMRSISKSKLANSNDSEGNQQEDYGCHGDILRSPEKAYYINGFRRSNGTYYTTITPFVEEL